MGPTRSSGRSFALRRADRACSDLQIEVKKLTSAGLDWLAPFDSRRVRSKCSNCRAAVRARRRLLIAWASVCRRSTRCSVALRRSLGRRGRRMPSPWRFGLEFCETLRLEGAHDEEILVTVQSARGASNEPKVGCPRPLGVAGGLVDHPVVTRRRDAVEVRVELSVDDPGSEDPKRPAQ